MKSCNEFDNARPHGRKVFAFTNVGVKIDDVSDSLLCGKGSISNNKITAASNNTNSKDNDGNNGENIDEHNNSFNISNKHNSNEDDQQNSVIASNKQNKNISSNINMKLNGLINRSNSDGDGQKRKSINASNVSGLKGVNDPTNPNFVSNVNNVNNVNNVTNQNEAGRSNCKRYRGEAGTADIRQVTNKKRNIFMISDICLSIYSFMTIKDIMHHSRINTYFYDIVTKYFNCSFTLQCNGKKLDGDLDDINRDPNLMYPQYFECSIFIRFFNNLIENQIKSEFGANLSNICKFYVNVIDLERNLESNHLIKGKTTQPIENQFNGLCKDKSNKCHLGADSSKHSLNEQNVLNFSCRWREFHIPIMIPYILTQEENIISNAKSKSLTQFPKVSVAKQYKLIQMYMKNENNNNSNTDSFKINIFALIYSIMSLLEDNSENPSLNEIKLYILAIHYDIKPIVNLFFKNFVKCEQFRDKLRDASEYYAKWSNHIMSKFTEFHMGGGMELRPNASLTDLYYGVFAHFLFNYKDSNMNTMYTSTHWIKIFTNWFDTYYDNNDRSNNTAIFNGIFCVLSFYLNTNDFDNALAIGNKLLISNPDDAILSLLLLVNGPIVGWDWIKKEFDRGFINKHWQSEPKVTCLERLKYLSKLCFSSLFGIQLFISKRDSKELYKTCQTRITFMVDEESGFHQFISDWEIIDESVQHEYWRYLQNIIALMFKLSNIYYYMSLNAASTNKDDNSINFYKQLSFREQETFPLLNLETRKITGVDYGRMVDCSLQNDNEITLFVNVCNQCLSYYHDTNQSNRISKSSVLSVVEVLRL